MDRRTLLRTAGLVAVAATPGAPAAWAAPTARYPASPVVSWELVGGFVLPGYLALRPPRLVAYADGLAIADATGRLRLPEPELDGLVRHAVRVLSDPANGRRRPGVPVVADVPATLLRARNRYALQVDALDETRGDHAYPRALYALVDQLRAVYDRVRAAGRAYRADGIRLVAISGEAPDRAAAWPAGVPVPTIDPDTGYGRLDLFGAPARTMARSTPQAYRTDDGRVLRVLWRYLLPDELKPHV